MECEESLLGKMSELFLRHDTCFCRVKYFPFSSFSSLILSVIFFIQVDALNHESPGISAEASQVSVTFLLLPLWMFTFQCVS